MLDVYRRHSLASTGGALLGLLAVVWSPTLWHAAQFHYGATNPVWVQGEATQINWTAEHATFSIVATKVRDCRFSRLSASVAYHDGLSVDAYIHRVDKPMTGITLAMGRQRVGVFRVQFVSPDPRAVVLMTENRCADRPVFSLLADVRPPQIQEPVQ